MQSATNTKNMKAGKLILAAALGLGLASCGGMPTNNSVYSVHKPVVERQNFMLDVTTTGSGLPVAEQSRLNGWFEAMDLRYGDRISIEDPAANPAVIEDVSELAGRYGILVSETAPTTEGFVEPGQVRVVLTRSSASVPGCPDWSATSDMNYTNATSTNYGCATNANVAAMVANPEDLLEGRTGSSETLVATGSRAINSLRESTPTGAGGLQDAGAAQQGQGGGN